MTAPDAVEAAQWCPDGNPMSGRPGEITRLLASPDGKTRGYGYGPGWSMGFGTEHGDLFVYPGQWVVKHADGTFSVTDTDTAPTLTPKEK